MLACSAFIFFLKNHFFGQKISKILCLFFWIFMHLLYRKRLLEHKITQMQALSLHLWLFHTKTLDVLE